jgi:branched-chain amino acid transport system substrate-binding protein
VGHLQSYVTAPAAAIYEQAGLLTMVPMATDPALTMQGHRRVFRATFTDRDTGRQLAEYAASRFRRVAICYIRNTYGRGLANAFEEHASGTGLVVAARQSYDSSEQVSARTFHPIVQEWKSLELDAIFLAGEIPSAALFVALARADGLSVPIFGGDAVGAPTLMTMAGAAAEGMVVTSFFHPDEPRPEVQQFTRLFQQRFGRAPDAAAAIGYDVIQVLPRGMREAGSTKADEVARALRALPSWSGATGRFRFDEHGAAIGKEPIMMTVTAGSFRYQDEGSQVSKTEGAGGPTRP